MRHFMRRFWKLLRTHVLVVVYRLRSALSRLRWLPMTMRCLYTGYRWTHNGDKVTFSGSASFTSETSGFRHNLLLDTYTKQHQAKKNTFRSCQCSTACTLREANTEPLSICSASEVESIRWGFHHGGIHVTWNSFGCGEELMKHKEKLFLTTKCDEWQGYVSKDMWRWRKVCRRR
jgi:hypothetical protein